MSEIIGTDIKTINIKVPLSVMFHRLGEYASDIQLYGSGGSFRFFMRNLGEMSGDIIWKNEEYLASIKKVNFDSENMLHTFLQLIDFATNKARLDMNLLYNDNHIVNVFVQDGNKKRVETNSLVSDYALSLVNDLPMKDEAISKFLHLVSRLQQNNLEILIPDISKRETIEKINLCLKERKVLVRKLETLDRDISLHLLGRKVYAGLG